jgi:GTP-binding protein
MTRPAGSVVLVGRPNVGKSTLFNRITATRRSIVNATPGTTRDVISADAAWRGVGMRLVDTGGMFGASLDPLQQLVVKQGRRALESADVLVFVVDSREGLVSADEEIASTLRATGRPVVLAVNKVDAAGARSKAFEFYRLGFDPVVEISAEHGLNIGDLMEEVIGRLPAKPRDGAGAGAAPLEVGVAIVGRPNVGKSSLVNRLLREERVLVSDMPGTTRDPVDEVLRWHRREFRIVDTAGIRRPGRVARSGAVEMVSVLAARRAIASADVAVVVIDAETGATDQDAAIAGEVDRSGRGLIIAANKWDLMKGRGPEYVKEFDENLRYSLKFADYASILHLSARTGERVPKLLEQIDRVAEARTRRVPTPELNKFIEAVTAAHPPVSPGTRRVRIMYAAQVGVAPPVFVFFTNIATRFHFSYERFLVNRLREAFGFLGSPIRIQVRRRSGSKKDRA